MQESPARPRLNKARDRNINLKKYYGIAAASENAPQPYNIDNKDFDNVKYFSRLLKEQPLGGLIKKDNELISEIRQIDGDMKTLVYENYNKFISATDTIRKMKSNVEDMESETTLLNENISSITQQCSTIKEALGPNREKVKQLGNVHNLLKRLQFIFELPDRLNRCIAKDRYAQAVRYYVRASALLNHYQHMTAFSGIEKDCHQIMETVKTKLWEHMGREDATSDEIGEDTKLLVLLKYDMQTLWTKYITLQTALLKKKQDQHPEPENIDEFINIYLVALEDIVQRFDSFFLSTPSDETSEKGHAGVAHLGSAEKKEAKEDLLKGIQGFIDRFFDLVQRFLHLPDDILEVPTPLKQVQYLGELCIAITKHGNTLSTVAGIDRRMNDLSNQWEGNLIDRLLGTGVKLVKERTGEFFANLSDSGVPKGNLESGDVAAFTVDIDEGFLQHFIERCIRPLHESLNVDVPVFARHSRSQFLDRLQIGVKTMCLDVCNDITTTSTTLSKKNTVASPALKLIGSRLCYDFAEWVVAQIYSHFTLYFLSSDGIDSTKNPAVHDKTPSIDPRFLPDMHHIMDEFLKSGQWLLNAQVMEWVHVWSSRLQGFYLYEIDSHLGDVQVSPLWKEIMLHLRSTEQLVDTVMSQPEASPGHGHTPDTEYDYPTGSISSATGGEGPYMRHVQSTQSLASLSSAGAGTADAGGLGIISNFGSGLTLNMMNNIDKLFADRVDIYRHVEPTPSGVCSALVRILLKAFHETVREMQMHEATYQQVQVDVEYCRRTMWGYVGDEKWANTILQDIMTSAYMRCENPVSVASERLERILSSQSH